MCRVGTCCFCVPLRTGCIVIAILGMMMSFSSIANIERSGIAVTIVSVVIGISVNGILLFGAIKNNSLAVLVHLILDIFYIVGCIIVWIIVVALVAKGGGASTTVSVAGAVSVPVGGLAIAVTILLSALIMLDIYFWIVTFSFYRELKSGNM